MKASGGRGASLFHSGDLGVARTTGCPVIWRSKSLPVHAVRFALPLARSVKSLSVFAGCIGRLLVHSRLALLGTAAKGVHSLGMQMPRDSPQKSLIKVRDFSADFIGRACCADPCPAIWDAGRRGRGFPGRGSPEARALAWCSSSPAPPSALGAPRSAADGRQGMLEAKVHPEVGVSVAGACRISHLHRCAILTAPPKTTAGCSFTAAAGPGCCRNPGPPP